MVNILTIDVEDYFQVENFKKVIAYSDWDKFECRVEKNSDKILKILSEQKVKATFFVLGWIAERSPALIKKIHSAGHEIASHGYAHQLIYKQTPEEFRSDIRKSKSILEDITKGPVLGYRAPTYSITKQSLWAIDILMEEGFVYDSSIFPIHHDKGGLSDAKRYPYKIERNGKMMIEFPISTMKFLGQNMPFSGGGYFRMFSYGLIRRMTKKVNNEGYPVNIYLHPWEFDPEQPRIKVGKISGFRHYLNLSKTEGKLKQLLKDFEFAPVWQLLDCISSSSTGKARCGRG